MTSWCSTLEESWNDWGPAHVHNTLLLCFTVALCRLVRSCSRLVADLDAESTAAMSNLTSEWNDVFAEAAFSTVVPLFMRLAQRWNKIHNPYLDHVLESLVACVSHVPRQHLSQTVDVLCPLLMAKQPAIQLAAYGLIKK